MKATHLRTVWGLMFDTQERADYAPVRVGEWMVSLGGLEECLEAEHVQTGALWRVVGAYGAVGRTPRWLEGIIGPDGTPPPPVTELIAALEAERSRWPKSAQRLASHTRRMVQR